MTNRFSLITLASLALAASAAGEALEPPEKALRYHEVLLKRPGNDQLFDRFFSAWIDEQPVEALDAFLKSRAEKEGGAHWTVLAKHLLRRGNEEGALAALGKALESSEKDPLLSMERAKILMRRMDFAGARADLEAAAKAEDPAVALEAGKLLGRTWLREGKLEEAVKAWDAALLLNASDEDLLEDLVEAAAAEGALEPALVYMDKLIGVTSDPYQKALRSLRRAELLTLSGKSDEAVASYATTLEATGESSWLESEVIAQIVRLFQRQDRLTDLAEQLQKLADAHPRRLLIQRELAKLELAQGEVDKAIGRFREVLKRSPGERALREEFVRLLTDGEKYDEAAEEMERLIAAAPSESALQLQLADLRERQGDKAGALAALEKARELLGGDEAAGLRISGLLFQYGMAEEAEAMLVKLTQEAGAGPAPAEALAAYYGRSNRKPEALELLKKIGAMDDMEAVLRASASLSALGETEVAFELLKTRSTAFQEPRFLSALAQAALASGKPEEALPPALRLVKTATQPIELAESLSLATRAIEAEGKADEWRAALEKNTARTTGETCLLATLNEEKKDYNGVSALLGQATDPLLVHFHAALLDRRGSYEEAIQALLSLAETEEGRKATFFKDLSSLQQRAGKMQDAIDTVERWKQSAPGDRAAWTTSIQLLRSAGRLDDAAQTARLATSRFEGDVDLSATLASLMEETGKAADAEAVYWRLYDEAQSPSDQARWAAQLAQTAVNTGRAEELEEKLQERAKGNARSLGPILARAELARLQNNPEKQGDLLREAIRLQPKEVDLRLQVANLEEESGELDRAVAVLEEAVLNDTTGRARSALAQAYMRQGETLKGLRELRAASAQRKADPRSAEQTASALAASDLYEEAIRFLRDELPDGGDWRSNYLLASLLERDGREEEATALFLSLLNATGEIPSLTATSTQGARFSDPRWSPEAQTVTRLWEAARTAYAHDNPGRRISRSGMNSSFFVLPGTPEEARHLSLSHLARIASDNPAIQKEMDAALLAAGVRNFEFIKALANATPDQGRPEFIGLLEAYPKEPGLAEAVFLMGYGNLISPAQARKVLESNKNLGAGARLQGWLRIVSGNPKDEEGWNRIVELAQEQMSATEDTKIRLYQSSELLALVQPRRMRGGEFPAMPEPQRAALREILVKTALGTTGTDLQTSAIRLEILSRTGAVDAWITAANDATDEFRKDPSAYSSYNRPLAQGALANVVTNRRRITMSGGSLAYDPTQVFASPEVSGYWPRSASPLIRILPRAPVAANSEEEESDEVGTITAPGLKAHVEKLKSPAVRAWVLLVAGDPAAAEKELADSPSDEEQADFHALKAFLLLQQEKPAAAFASLEEAQFGSDQESATWKDLTMIAIAAKLSEDERAAVADTLSEAFTRSSRQLGQAGGNLLAVQAEKFGLTELAATLRPVAAGLSGVAALQASRPAGFSSTARASRQVQPLDKIREFAEAKKFNAAAREAQVTLRALRAGNYRYSQDDEGRIKDILGETGMEELLKLVDPGDSKSLVRRLEFADICRQLGRNDLALPVLEAIHKERPGDASVAARLVFVLPREKEAERSALMTAAAQGQDFVDLIRPFAEKLHNEQNNPEQVIDFHSTVADWLESADPETLKTANLSWVNYFARQFFDNIYPSRLPSLLNQEGRDSDDKRAELIALREKTARRLAEAMLRYPASSEEGFRLLNAARAWTLKPEEKDAYVRQVLETVDENQTAPFFVMSSAQGQYSGGDDMARFASIQWLTSRLKEGVPAQELLPADWIARVKEKNPFVGSVLELIAGSKGEEQLQAMWSNGSLDSVKGRHASLLSAAVFDRISALPGSDKFILTALENAGGMALRQGRSMDSKEAALVKAALTIMASSKDQKIQEKLGRKVEAAIYGEKPEWDKLSGNTNVANTLYGQGHMMTQLLQTMDLDAERALNLARALQRLRIPVGTSPYPTPALAHRQILVLNNADEAEHWLTEAGCLADIREWNPVSSTVMLYNRGGFELKTVGIDPASLGQYSFNQEELRTRLIARKKGRFGSLITAAMFSYGDERAQLALDAMKEASGVISGLPKETLERLEPVVELIGDAGLAKLPAKARAKFDFLVTRRHEGILARANTYLTNNTLQSGEQELIQDLISFDADTAVKVLIEMDRRFSMNNRGNVSNYNGYTLDYRDYMLSAIFERHSGGPGSSPERMLRFLEELSKTPEAQRFHLSPRFPGDSYGGGFVDTGRILLQEVYRETSQEKPLIVSIALKRANELPADIRGDGLVATAAALLRHSSDFREHPMAEGESGESVPEAKIPDSVKPYVTLVRGLREWDKADEAARTTTLTALLQVLKNESLSIPARQALAFTALSTIPALLEDDDAADAIATLYEAYCDADRSAVNGWSGQIFRQISTATLNEKGAANIGRFLTAFWKNARSPKPAGHSPIGPDLAGDLLLVTIRSGDEDAAIQLHAEANGQFNGSLSMLALLVEEGRFELARRLLLPLQQAPSIDRPVSFTRQLEEKLPEFRKILNNPSKSFLFEYALLSAGAADGEAAPQSTLGQRALSVATLANGNLPASRVEKVEILCRLIKTNALVIPELRQELKAATENLEIPSVLSRWEKNPGGVTAEMSNYELSDMELELCGAAAMADLLENDSAAVEKLVNAYIAAPVLAKGVTNDQSPLSLQKAQGAFVKTASFWLWTAVARGKTAGFESQLELFEKLARNADKRHELENHNRHLLAICRFLAEWSGHPERFTALQEELQGSALGEAKAMLVNSAAGQLGRAAFVSGAQLDEGALSVLRKQGLAAIFEHEAFQKGIDPLTIEWLQELAQTFPRDELAALIEDEGVEFPATLKPSLYHFLGTRLLQANKTEPSISAFQKCLESIPNTPEWDKLRGGTKTALAYQLAAAEKKDEAAAILTSITANELEDRFVSRYRTLTATLGVRDVTEPEPTEKPEAPKTEAAVPNPKN